MSGNYTGPYWSDGTFQTSVEFGDAQPLDYVDEMSRLHDSAYAKFKGDDRMLRAADELYFKALEKDPSLKAKLAREAVLYGNYTMSKLSRLAEIEKSAVTLGPLGLLGGLLYFGVENIIDMSSRLGKDKYAKEKEILKDYYKSDPKRRPEVAVPSVPTQIPSVSTGTTFGVQRQQSLAVQDKDELTSFIPVARKRRRRRRRKIRA